MFSAAEVIFLASLGEIFRRRSTTHIQNMIFNYLCDQITI